MNRGVKPGVRAYVLAGGGSTRFGRDKALVTFGGVPLLLRIVTMAQACTVQASVVAATEKYADLDARLEIVNDRWPGEGPLGGIITALQNTVDAEPNCKWNLILSCDMPFLTENWLAFLIERANSSPAQVVLPHSTHGPEPLCACYRTDALAKLQTVFAGGVRKVTDALKQVRREVLDESVWKRFDSQGRLFWNMNTVADFEEAQHLWHLKTAANRPSQL